MNPLTVMLVDDEAAFVETMVRRLAKRNFKVLSAFGGREALEILQADSHVDVVILDVKMPEMDGIKTLREIKKNHPLVEVIMLTGHATVENAIDGLRLGAFDYLMKPCDLETLLAKLAEAGEKKAKQEEKILDAQIREITLRRGG